MNVLLKLIIAIFLLCNINLAFTLTCHGNEFLCADGKKCVDVIKLCNYESDCDDSSDETNFALCKELKSLQKNCGPGYVECRWTDCLSLLDACGYSNCLDATENAICLGTQNKKLKPFIRETNLEETSPEDLYKFNALLEFIGEAFNETIKRNFTVCPPFYTPFQDKCYSFFTPAQVKWSEAKLFCESISGRLAVLDDIKTFKDALDYIHLKELEADFWVGGKIDNEEFSGPENSINSWMWLNKEAIEMGAPFWSLGIPQNTDGFVCSDLYGMAMRPTIKRSRKMCLALLKNNHYYFSDEDCDKKFSPVCVTENREI